MELLHSASMGASSMVLSTLIIYLCFTFIFIGNFQLLSSSRTNMRTHIDTFGYSVRELEIYSFTTFFTLLTYLILQPVIYIVLFTSYGLDVIAYAKFLILLSASLILERLFFLEMILKRSKALKSETLFLHTIGLGVTITLILGNYFKSVGA